MNVNPQKNINDASLKQIKDFELKVNSLYTPGLRKDDAVLKESINGLVREWLDIKEKLGDVKFPDNKLAGKFSRIVTAKGKYYEKSLFFKACSAISNFFHGRGLNSSVKLARESLIPYYLENRESSTAIIKPMATEERLKSLLAPDKRGKILRIEMPQRESQLAAGAAPSPEAISAEATSLFSEEVPSATSSFPSAVEEVATASVELSPVKPIIPEDLSAKSIESYMRQYNHVSGDKKALCFDFLVPGSSSANPLLQVQTKIKFDDFFKKTYANEPSTDGAPIVIPYIDSQNDANTCYVVVRNPFGIKSGENVEIEMHSKDQELSLSQSTFLKNIRALVNNSIDGSAHPVDIKFKFEEGAALTTKDWLYKSLAENFEVAN